jgi:predicted transcriptional regulator
MSQDTRDLLETVFKRVEFLEALDETPMAKRDLVDRLDVSRSTVNRGIWDLEQYGLVKYDDGGYRLTVCGRLLHDQYRRYEAGAEAVGASADLLELLPPSAPVDVSFLRHVDIYIAEDPAPHVPVTVLSKIIREATQLQGLSRSHAAPKTVDALRELVAGRGGAEIVFREAVYDHVDGAYDWIRDRVANGDLRAYLVDDLPYGLVIADQGDRTYGCLVVYDGNSSIAGVLVNDTEAAAEWATDVFASYRERAEPVADRD